MVRVEKKTAGAPANAVHPGEMLREEFLVPLGIKPAQLAKALGIPVPRINDLVRERRTMTADTALRLSRFFGNSAQFWMNLQSEYDLNVAVAKAKGIQKIKPLEARVA
jgi:addiction module HigA family antidote